MGWSEFWKRAALALLILGCGPSFVQPTALAADKNGVSPNSISLPKGPGSIEGLGESFQPTLNTGTAKYSLKLKLAPGTAGHQPQLSLDYEGGGGNGPLGYGWTLTLPHIQRRTDQGIPTYGVNLGVARSDTFINEAREELVPRADGYYFCENEGAFVRYRPVGDHWEGTAPNGRKLEFGLTAAGRVEDAAAAQTFCWLLERETDTHGNVIEYRYRAFSGEDNLNQKYLAAIRYGPGPPPWTQLHFVAFEYESRPDWFEDGRAGFLIRTGHRLRSIAIGTQGANLPGHLAGDFNGDGTPDILNRRYDLGYRPSAGPDSPWSLLERVTLVGADGATALPPARFDYAVSAPPAQISALPAMWSGQDEPLAVMDNPQVDLIDLNADGLPDVLKTEPGGGAHTVAVNQGPVQPNGRWSIRWSSPVEVNANAGSAWNFDLASERTHLADMDGDGLADLVHKSADDTVFYFSNQGRLAWGPRRDMTLEGMPPPAPFSQTGVRTADVDFDKRMDIVQSLDLGGGIAYRVWFNLGNQAYSAPATFESDGGFDFTVPGVDLIDCNGDRVPDVARVQPGAVQVAAGIGYGRFAAPRAIVVPDVTLDELQVAKAKLTDINGDGLADLVLERAEPGACWYWLNLGNYTFTTRHTIVDLPAALSAHAVVRWADLNGNGTTDLIYADSESQPRLQMIELGELVSGGLMPNLLTRIENGLGRVIHITYAPSTRFALADAAAGRPWPESVPFPVTVVAAVTVGDSLGHEYVTRLQYHDGFYDHEEKQFRGFGEVELVEVGDPTAPTLVSRSFFDTGRTFDAMKGRLLRFATETEDGRVFQEEITTWADPPRTLLVGTNGRPVRFAHPVARATQIRERDQGTPRMLRSEFAYDDFGNPTRVADFGIVEGDDLTAFDDERVTLTQYALNLPAWIVRLPKRQRVQDENGAVIARSECFYDDETFSGNNPGSVTVGNLTLRRDWIAPSNDTAFVQSARTKFDGYGNPVLQIDPLGLAPGGNVDLSAGHARALAYDLGFHTFTVAESIHVGEGRPPLVFQAAFDVGFACVTSASDFNSNATRFAYDPLGRLTHVTRPLDAEAYPTTEYEYVLQSAAPYVDATGLARTGVVNYVETRRLDRPPETAGPRRNHYVITRQFVDGLGRTVMTRSEAEPATGDTAPRVVVNGAVLFNARQSPARTLNPFFTLRSGSLEEQLAFENIEAPGWKGQFHHDGALVSLDLATAHQSGTEYDATLRITQAVNADGSLQRIVYEPLVTRSFDENDANPSSPHAGTPILHFADGLGRLIRVDELVRLADDGTSSGDLRAWTTRYAYDLNDCLTRVTDSQNNMKVLRFDGLKRKTSMEDPDSGISTYVHDAASNLRELRDAKGQRTTYTFDGANRLATVDYQDGASAEFSHGRSPDIRFHYDQPAPPVDSGDGRRVTAHNTLGALVYVEDTSGEEHLSYDARGRKEWIVKRVLDPLSSGPPGPPGQAPLVSYQTAFDYDSLDRVSRLVYPDHDQITYEYNARNLLDRIGGGPSGAILPSMAYAPSGQPSRILYGNGVSTARDYDERLRLNRLITSHPAPATELVHFRYEFDGVSNVQAIHDARPADAVSDADPRRNSQTFTYDDRYRLTRVQYNLPNQPGPGNGGEIRYRYDRIGNLLEQTSDLVHLEQGLSITDLGQFTYGGAAGRFNRIGRRPGEAPGPHAATGVNHPQSSAATSYHYDANGSQTEIDGRQCTWDFENHLVAVEDATLRADYAYDYTGRRIAKKVTRKQADAAGDSVSATVYVGSHFEVRDHDQPTKYVFSGSIRVARVTGSLSANQRLQRIRLQPGWNLVALAVTASNLIGQAQPAAPGGSPVIGVYRWTDVTSTYVPLTTGESVAAGSILWVKAATNGTIGIVGAYADPANRLVPAGGHFLPGTGLEAWSPSLPPTLAAWNYRPDTRAWRARLPGDLGSVAELPRTFAPGQALFLVAQTPFELTSPEPALRIHYYHQDHLGSSSVITDANGALVEETAFYPFGLARHEHRLRPEEDPYQFSQKERDAESGLHYFEARYLAARLARFVTMDPKYSHPDQLAGAELTSFLANPQALNPYAYVFNNPLCYRDPSGLDPNSENDTKKHLETINKGSDFLGALAGGAELFAKEGGTLWGVTKAGGAATSFIGVAFKGVELINDPNADTASAFSWEVSKGAIGTLNPIAGVAIYVGELFGLDIGKGLNWVGHKIGTSLAEGPNLIEMVQEHRQDVGFRQRSQKAAELRRMVAATKTGIKNMEEVAPFLENTGYQAEARNLREQIKQSHAEIRDLEEQIRNVHKNR